MGTVTFPAAAGERLYSVYEVARYMRVSKAVVYRLIWSGNLEAGKIRGSWRVPERAVRGSKA